MRSYSKSDFKSTVNQFVGKPNLKKEQKEIQKVADYFKCVIKH
ncbi:hypothetical protein WR164_01370 [Philodulcilactobacillus myokoensis]|uniref:Uncharacterized protein n=1 Tax=Philodulcilactobacillus myokoensis TaxID=2929573 RepID=A0A9W6AZY5_9LACO|nr:hypothetical protein WR164_01370 [Philodulcilactobacillus myokoensis]